MSVSSRHPFMQISREQQRQVSYAINKKTELKIDPDNYRAALDFLLGKTTVISSDVQAIVDVMNLEAQKILNSNDLKKDSASWKKVIDDLTGIFPYDAGRRPQQGTSYGALGMGGFTVWAALRNSKLLAAANGCAAISLDLLLTFS